MHPISITAWERVRVNFTAFEIRLTSASRSMERSPYHAGNTPTFQTILRPFVSWRTSVKASSTSCSRLTIVLWVSARPILEKAKRSSIRLPIRCADSRIILTYRWFFSFRSEAVFFLQELRESGHMAKGRAEVMRYGISKCFQFLINDLKLSGPFSKFFVKRANFLLAPFALGDVIVRFQDRSGPPLLVSPQRPSAAYYHLAPISLGLLEFAIPTLGAQQFRANFFNRRR